jgi:hypothetical protein
MTNLVLQSFGRESEYRRAVLTVLSYYACTSLNISQTKVLLFTDQPDYFTSFFEQLPVDYILLTPEKVKEMRGRIDFLHRMKIALIDEAFDRAKGNILYADSDTFFTADPTPLMEKLSEEQCFMHLWEYQFESLKERPLPAGKTFQDFFHLIKSSIFTLYNGESIRFSLAQSSWNAGVMMFHSSHKRFIQDVYALTDQFYPPTKNHASEQYAFSLILQSNITVSPCDNVICHYWYIVKKAIMDAFLKKKVHKEWGAKNLQEKLADVKKWTSIMPRYFARNILMLRDNAIQAFNVNNFKEGYKWAAKAFFKEPFEKKFIRNVLYHSKRALSIRKTEMKHDSNN